jgi:hypothetical protein
MRRWRSESDGQITRLATPVSSSMVMNMTPLADPAQRQWWRTYHLARVWPASQAKIDVAAAQAADTKFAASEGRHAPPLRLTPLENPIACALATISETDMTLMGVRDFGPGRGADPRTRQGRRPFTRLPSC